VGRAFEAPRRAHSFYPQQDYFDRGTQSTRVNNLIRMNQGKMMGIDFDFDKSWIGASVAPHD
jgi:hypothetical protein